MNGFRKFGYILAFLSPLLGETDLVSIAGIKIPALTTILFFIAAFILSRRKQFVFLFSNRLFNAALLYFVIILFNYAFVLHNLFFKASEELTPLWISIFRRMITVLFIFFAFRDVQQGIRLFHFYCAGLVLSSLSAYPEMFLLKHTLFNASITEGNEGYQRAIGFFTNPNDFALTTVVALVFVFNYYLFTRSKFLLILSILLIPPVFLSFSRNGLACLFITLFLTFNVGKKVKWKTVLYILFSFLSLCFIIYSVPSIRERVLLLFSGDDSSAIGRMIVIYTAFQKWLTMPLLGIGVYFSPLLMEGFGNSGLVITIHNFYAHALLETGVIGFSIVLWFLICFYKSIRKVFRSQPPATELFIYSKAALITLLVTCFYIFSGNHILFEFFWYMVGVQLVILRAEYKRIKQTPKNLYAYA
ncbi:MAG: O-antigen ligase family protein [Flavisolibacter sp.]|nr:O-antigen ligase family protein [Flavisolibacter sp.]